MREGRSRARPFDSGVDAAALRRADPVVGVLGDADAALVPLTGRWLTALRSSLRRETHRAVETDHFAVQVLALDDGPGKARVFVDASQPLRERHHLSQRFLDFRRK